MEIRGKEIKMDDIPTGVEISKYIMEKIQLVAAFIVVILFAVGVVDLAIAIFQSYQSGRITEVTTVIEFIEFVLLLFILVEAYRTIIAYAESKQAGYILTLVIYAGVIAVIRKIIVHRPTEYANIIDAMFVSIGYAVLLISLGIMLYILDNHGSIMRYNLDDDIKKENEDKDFEEKENN